MVRDIIFHLGDPKTGTTSIQQTLATQNWRCDGVKVLYPAPINHLPLAATLHSPKEFGNREAQFRKLARHLDTSDADIAVISAELFEIVNPEDLKAALATYLPAHAATARFICYLRPHADRLLSAYVERVKQGIFLESLETFHARMLNKQRLLYTARCQKWRAVFGDRYEVRPMIREHLLQQDVVRDFLDYLFEGRPFDLIDEPVSNEALSLEDLAMLREVHLLLQAQPALMQARKSLGWNFATMLAETPRPGTATKPRLHRSLAERVIDSYRADALAVDAAFFEGNPMRQALESVVVRAAEEPQSIDAADHFPSEELRMIRVWARLTALLLQRDPDSLPRHFRTRTIARFAQARSILHGGDSTPDTAASRTGRKVGPKTERKTS